MTLIELQQILARGEDSQHQFKQNITNTDSLAAEMVAMANAVGGKIIIGVNDNGEITGLSSKDIRRLNQLISNVASDFVKPPITPLTENIQTDKGLLIVISVPSGLNKPYLDKSGVMWVKSGSDKRRVTSREEMQRLFQAAGLIHADGVPVQETSQADLDRWAFQDYYKNRYHEEPEEITPRLLQNLGLLKSEQLTLAGLLLFGKNPQRFKPIFLVKAIVFPGDNVDISQYLDNEDIEGNLAQVYKDSFAFVRRNLHHVQNGQGINSLGQPEIPLVVIEELLVNALIHRDYFISAPIRLFIFRDRIELISPGHLPNHLTIEQVRCGLSNMRNPLLATHATHILPYRGLGTGIPRVLESYNAVEFTDDREANQFKVVIKRRFIDISSR
jgi:predicted HTH transcriptional regulator